MARPPKKKQPIDPEKLRVFLHKLDRGDLLQLVERAIDLLPAARLPMLVKGYFRAKDLAPDARGTQSLSTAVKAFREASLKGEFYESFNVNSKNFMEKSRGTENWIAEWHRLTGLCLREAEKSAGTGVRESFEILFDLLRHIDKGNDDVIFFADEGGSWQVGVGWDELLPVYFRSLAATAEAEEYADAVLRLVHDFVDYRREPYLRKARGCASAAQKKALSARISLVSE